jgi:hypothetical protein
MKKKDGTECERGIGYSFGYSWKLTHLMQEAEKLRTEVSHMSLLQSEDTAVPGE